MQERYNALLKRTEIVAAMDSQENPGFEKARADIAKECKADEEAIVIKAVRSHFGRHSFAIEADIYDSVEQKNKIEQKPKAKKAAEGAK